VTVAGPVSTILDGRLRPPVRRFRTGFALAFVLLASSLTVVNGEANAQSLSYDGSLRYSTGSYNLGHTVTSGFLLNELTWSSSRWYAELTVPVIWQDSADVRYVGGMPMPGGIPGEGGSPGHGAMSHHPGHPGDPEPPVERTSDTALSDPYLRVGADVYRSLFGTSTLGIFGTVKFPVADENRGFGTGEWDVAAGIAWTHSAPASYVHLEVAYWSLGGPSGVAFENPLAVELSYGRFLNEGRYLIEATAWGRTETLVGVDGPLAMDLTFHRSLGNARWVYVTVEAGFTESAPNYALAVGYRVRLWQQ